MDFKNDQPMSLQVQTKEVSQPALSNRRKLTETTGSKSQRDSASGELDAKEIHDGEDFKLSNFEDKFQMLYDSVQKVLADGVINRKEVDFLQHYALGLGFHHEIVQFLTDQRTSSKEQLKSAILQKKLY